jgi:hypothetical protein
MVEVSSYRMERAALFLPPPGDGAARRPSGPSVLERQLARGVGASGVAAPCSSSRRSLRSSGSAAK